MKLRATTVVACALVATLAAASTAGAQTAGVKATIDASNKKFAAALEAGDAKTIATLFTEDAMVMPPYSEAVRGRQAIEGLFQALAAAGIKQAVLTAQEVEVHGESATEIGTFSIKDATGKEVDRGKYVAVWKRVKGQWQMHRDIWNSSLPMPAPR